MFFLSWMFLLSAAKYDVVWTDLNIYIPLTEEVSPYTLLPKVTVYENDVLVNDLEIYYMRGVERTFLSVLHSNEVKTFYIKYRVYIPSIHIDQIVTISFHIVDITPPVITVSSPIKIAHGQKMNILDHIKVSDNYYASNLIVVNVDTSKVDHTKVGIFEVIIKAVDPSNNEHLLTTSIEIYDAIAPEITLIKQIVLNPHTELILSEFVKVKDNVDTFIKLTYDDQYVVFDTIGIYPIFIYATDQSLNVTSVSYMVEIKDLKPPVLILVSQPPEIEVNHIVTQDMLLSFVLDYYDAYDTQPELEVKNDINPFKIGVYMVYYTLTDASHNQVKQSLKVHVIDRIAPTVMSHTDDLVFEVFHTLNPLITYFLVDDNYDTFESLTVTIKENIDVKKIGMYEVIIDVSDTSKNKKTYRFYVHIKDTTPPVLNQDTPLIITTFLRPDYHTLLMYSDQYDNKMNIHLEVDDAHITYTDMGSHFIHVILTDASKNQSMTQIEVVIVDIFPPEIILKVDVIYINAETFFFDPFSYIDKIIDNREDIPHNRVTIKGNVLSDIGLYEVLYEVMDNSGLYGFKTLKVYVMDTTKPVVNTLNVTFQKEEMVDIFQGIEITDISETRLIILNTFDPNYLGTQTLYYVVYDTFGNETFFFRTITIENNSVSSRISPYIQSIFTLGVGSVVVFFMWYYFAKVDFDKTKHFKYNKGMSKE